MHTCDQILSELRDLELRKSAIAERIDALRAQLKEWLVASHQDRWECEVGRASLSPVKCKAEIDYRGLCETFDLTSDLLARHTETVYDWESIAEELAPPEELVEKFTKVTESAGVLRVTYR